MPEKAIAEFQEEIECRGRSFETVASLACAYAAAGRQSEARALLNELTDLSKKKYLPKVFFAYIHTALGEKEMAFEMLERAYSDRDINLLNLKNHPWLDPLRQDPRLRDLLKRVGLPE
jgi:serine/threonine-protein kinase